MPKSALFLIIPILMAASSAFGNIARCVLIDYSAFQEIQDNLYVSENISNDNYQKITALIAKARHRITERYGKPMANPVIIVVATEKETKDFDLHDIPGTTFFLPWESYLVLNYHKAGIDVVAHELVHAEIVDRIGYYKRVSEIPTWFDEGAALQVDFRSQYSSFSDISNTELNRVKGLDAPDKFWSNNKT